MTADNDSLDSIMADSILNDSLLMEANRLANRVYESNLDGKYWMH